MLSSLGPGSEQPRAREEPLKEGRSLSQHQPLPTQGQGGEQGGEPGREQGGEQGWRQSGGKQWRSGPLAAPSWLGASPFQPHLLGPFPRDSWDPERPSAAGPRRVHRRPLETSGPASSVRLLPTWAMKGRQGSGVCPGQVGPAPG